MIQKLSSNDLNAFTTWARVRDRFWDHVLTFDVVEDTERVFEIRVTECLWTKVFQKSGATDLGYAIVCNPDYALCQAFNPKIRLVRSKTLMRGEDCCDHRWGVGRIDLNNTDGISPYISSQSDAFKGLRFPKHILSICSPAKHREIVSIAGSVIIKDGSGSIDIHDVEKDVTIESDSSGSINISGIKGIVSGKN